MKLWLLQLPRGPSEPKNKNNATSANVDADEGVNMANSEKQTRRVSSYDETFDVIVVGYGYAGGISALEAAQHGARVLLIEVVGAGWDFDLLLRGGAFGRQRRKGIRIPEPDQRRPHQHEVVRALPKGMSETGGVRSRLGEGERCRNRDH